MAEALHVQLLDDRVINQIAAGEVVDRPASVVKELMENALDAGADQILVEVVSGGRKLIAVSDNGCGMSRDDALLSIERHATSKIRETDDLEQIHTMGFRGEALAAIASVSRFTLATRPADELAGTEINLAGGTLQDVKDVGCPAGTSMQVRNLFYNVPARKKFLRAEQTELAHVRQTFLVHALAHPEVGFNLKVDGRMAYELPAGDKLEDRLAELYSRDFIRGLRPVACEEPGLTLSGYAGLPSVSRKTRSDVLVFVNRRPASSVALASAVKEAYSGLLPGGRFPVLFLFIEIDPGEVDVNVHPAKKEVRFRRPGPLRDRVIDAIREALRSGSSREAPGKAAASPPQARPAMTITNLPAAPSFQYPRIPLVPESAARPQDLFPAPSTGPQQAAGPASGEEGLWSWCRILGQIAGLYVVMETDEGMVMMDPQAAHERVLFEGFLDQAEQGAVAGQGLLTPETVELPPRHAERLRRQENMLREMGFGITPLDGGHFLVDTVPALVSPATVPEVLLEVAEDLEARSSRGADSGWERDQVAQVVARRAVKAQDRLTLEEIEALVVNLVKTRMPYTSPDGRPTLVFTGVAELERKFGRR